LQVGIGRWALDVAEAGRRALELSNELGKRGRRGQTRAMFAGSTDGSSRTYHSEEFSATTDLRKAKRVLDELRT
jgi:hypothetical protein